MDDPDVGGSGQQNSYNGPCNSQHNPSAPSNGPATAETSPQGRSGRQKAFTRCSTRREERVTAQGPVKKPDVPCDIPKLCQNGIWLANWN